MSSCVASRTTRCGESVGRTPRVRAAGNAARRCRPPAAVGLHDDLLAGLRRRTSAGRSSSDEGLRPADRAELHRHEPLGSEASSGRRHSCSTTQSATILTPALRPAPQGPIDGRKRAHAALALEARDQPLERRLRRPDWPARRSRRLPRARRREGARPSRADGRRAARDPPRRLLPVFASRSLRPRAAARSSLARLREHTDATSRASTRSPALASSARPMLPSAAAATARASPRCGRA